MSISIDKIDFSAVSTFSEGKSLRYQSVKHVLGRGLYATVVQATDQLTQREVALKMVRVMCILAILPTLPP